jgi:SAM-dependent methyltransferase
MRTDRELFKNCAAEKATKIIRNHLCGLTLDVGCLDGLIVSTHTEAIGIDAVLNKSYIPLVLADMHHLPFKAVSFNTVVMCHVLEHTNKPNLALEEARRVLQVNGNLIIAIPNARNPASMLLRFLIGYDGHAFQKVTVESYAKHRIFLGPDDLRYLVQKQSFIIQKTFGSTPYIPKIERIFDLRLFRSFYWKLGDVFKQQAKDLIFIAKKL